MIFPKGSRNFGRELLYTGITRARKSIEIIGDIEEMKEVALKRLKRESLLGVRLNDPDSIRM